MNEILLPLYARLRDQLRAEIVSGTLCVGDKLPSEHELVRIHGVSRITVRQALSELQHEGLIDKIHGKGAYVSAARTSQSLDRLQGLGEAFSGLGRAVHSQRLSMSMVKAPPDVIRDLQLPDGAEVYQLLSLRYVEKVPVSFNESYYPLALGKRMVRMDLSGRDVIDVLERDFGITVAQARMDISSVAMQAKVATLLNVPPDEPALKVHRVLLDAKDNPVQIETTTYRSDKFSFNLVVNRRQS